SRPPPLLLPGQTVTPNLNRPLLSSSNRRRRQPPWCAPRQPPSPTQVSPPPRRFSRSPPRPAAGRAATQGVRIFTSATIQSPKSPIASATAPWPIWRRGLAASVVPASGSSLNGTTSGRVPKAPAMLHPSPSLSRQQEPQTTDQSVERLIGEL